jgi:hypothetical protein
MAESNVADVIREAFTESQGVFREAAGIKRDPDLEFYRSLNEDDFEAVRMKLGDDATFAWIRRMEARLQNIGK